MPFLLVALTVMMFGCEPSILTYHAIKSMMSDEALHAPNDVISYEEEYPDVVIEEMLAEDGILYTIEAIEGQICVWFKDGVSCKDAKKGIKKCGGEIVAQIPDVGYYLVNVPADGVSVFLSKINKVSDIDWAYPNLVSYSCMAYTYILDNFYSKEAEKASDDTTAHGNIVQFAMEECGSGSPIIPYNIGVKGGNKIVVTDSNNRSCLVNANTELCALKDIASSSFTGPIIINMSYGQSLRKRIVNGETVSYFWEHATKDEKVDYQERFTNAIRAKIRNLRPLEGRDYIVVVAAGNDGVKTFYADVISYMRRKLELYPKELEIIDKHFLFVTAGEEERADYYEKIEEDFEKKYKEAVRRLQKDSIIEHYDTMWRNASNFVRFVKTYSNEMEAGHYDPWVTKVDISDFQYLDKDEFGTSFAAPRAACILSLVANEKNLTGTEVLKYAREATKKNPGHVLTYELLNKTIEFREGQYLQNGCLLYRLVKDEENDTEQLELRNICDDDIGVSGCLVNAIASHGGANTLDFDVLVRAKDTEFLEGFVENICEIKSVETISNKIKTGAGVFDYHFVVSYSKEMFDNNSYSRLSMPNGDVIRMQYVYDLDFIPLYLLRFSLENGGRITSKYRIVAVKSLSDQGGFDGSDQDSGFIDMSISIMGFMPIAGNQLHILIREKM